MRARLRFCRKLLSLFCAVLALAGGQLAAQPEAAPAPMLSDAELTSVAFIDADRGWAVGDRGVIWHTSDGGRNWRQQASSVACRLEAVQFLDPDNGWIVGGWTQPYTHQTTGVVLRTRDGGRTWTNTPGLMLPALKQIKLFDAKNGWAVGESSALFPTGAFRTEDGGRTWTPVPKGRSAGWTTGDFRDPKSGAVAGHGGALGLVTSQEIRPSRTPPIGSRYLRRMQLTGELSGWLVGDGGLALTTSDGGFTWTTPRGTLPDIATRELDFRALAVFGNHCWMAGAPGTCVIHSADGGQTWEVQRTDQTLPIRGLTFVDENRGWAVGSLGTILATRDGGRTWRSQRNGGTRVAMLGIFSEAERLPFELFAQQSANDAFLSAVEIVGRRDQDSPAPGSETLPTRTHAAIVAVGGCQADQSWRFPLRQAGLPQSAATVMQFWNEANDGKASGNLEEHLVRRIRQWRPEVVVTDDVSPRGDDPLGHLTNQVVLAAALKAADLTAYSDQVTLGGLQPWKVKKVFSLQATDRQSQVNITPSQLASRYGRSLADIAEAGRGLLQAELKPSPTNVGLSLLIDHLPQQTGRRDVFSGIALLPGGEARREFHDPPSASLDLLAKLAQKRYSVEQLLTRFKSDDPTAVGWLSQVDDLTKGLNERNSGEILFQLAQRYHHSGQSESAADAMHLLLERYPNHPLADRAAIWLVQFYASGEVAWRERRVSKGVIQLATAESSLEDEAQKPPLDDDAPLPRAIGATMKMRGTGTTALFAPNTTVAERSGRAIAVAKSIERSRPSLHAEPRLLFPLAAAMRANGQPRQTERILAGFTSSGEANPWAQNALAEQWLGHAQAVPPKKMVSCVKVAQKPHLDGRLDDALWQQSKPVSLASARRDDDEWPAMAVMAYDDDFLYLAVSCRKAAGVEYPLDTKPRPRDSDLTADDHVEILLDIDRDYGSYYRLAFDYRGKTAESCFGDTNWNPAWYVAAGGDDVYWTVEAAIPLSELCPKSPQLRDVWAVGIQRTVPKVGFQSATQPAAVNVQPEGFGFLVFE